jgi:hypothetical protein
MKTKKKRNQEETETERKMKQDNANQDSALQVKMMKERIRYRIQKTRILSVNAKIK